MTWLNELEEIECHSLPAETAFNWHKSRSQRLETFLHALKGPIENAGPAIGGV